MRKGNNVVDGEKGAGRATIDIFRKQAEELGRLSQSRVVLEGDLPNALKEIARAATLGVRGERSTIWIYNPDQTVVRCVGSFVSGADGKCEGNDLTKEDFPNYFQAMEETRVCAVPDTEQDARGKELREGRGKEPEIRAFVAATFH